MGFFQSHKGVFDKNTLLKGTFRSALIGIHNKLAKQSLSTGSQCRLSIPSCWVSWIWGLLEDRNLSGGCWYPLGLAVAWSGPCNRSYCKAGIWGWLEDGSPPWRLLVPLWRPHLAQDQFCTTQGVQVGHGGQCGCHKDPCQTEFQFCWVLCMGGIKLQLLCGVRIELAVGSLPNLARIPSRSLPLPLGGT